MPLLQQPNSVEYNIVQIDKGRGLSPLLEFLDTVDLLRDSFKTEIKAKLFRKFCLEADTIARLLIREVKKQDNRAQMELRKMVLTPTWTLCRKYIGASLAAGAKMAKKVIARTIKKSEFDFLEDDDWERKEIAVINNAKDVVFMRINAATETYALQTKLMLSNIFMNGGKQTRARKLLGDGIRIGSRETGTYFNMITGAGQAFIFQVADMAAEEAFAFKEIQNQMRWVTFFTNSCPDCIDRHNRVLPYERWQAEGLPRSGATVCRTHCHCVLVPEEYPTDITAPVPRDRARIDGPTARVPMTPREATERESEFDRKTKAKKYSGGVT